MSSADVCDARDATESTGATELKYVKKESHSKSQDKKKNKKSRNELPEEEQYVDQTENSNSRRDQGMNAEETLQGSKKSGSTKKKTKSKKDKYKNGVLVATEIITVILEHHGVIEENTINTVLASLLCGKETIARSSKGKKALKKATKNDYSFVEMAMLAAETARDLGGNREEMKTAAASVLACRKLKEYKNFKFKRSHLLAIADAAAEDAVGKHKSVRVKNKPSYDSDSSSKGASLCLEDSDNELDRELENDSVTDTITLAVTSFDSIDQIRSGGLKVWRESVGDCFSYGFAEVLGCLGDQLVQASNETTRKIEETVINDYLIQNGVESYEIAGEHATWDPWVSENVDFVELEARFEKYFYTVATSKGTCTLEWPSGKKFLKQKMKNGGLKAATSKEVRSEMGL